jgi:hypothetical protein
MMRIPIFVTDEDIGLKGVERYALEEVLHLNSL